MNHKAKFNSIALLLLISLFAWGEQIVRVGYYPAPGMMNNAQDDATKSGYAYDYIQEVANRSGWKFSYVYGSFGELYQKLKSGEIDMLPYVTKTAKRANEVLFMNVPMGDERLYIGSMKLERLDDDLTGLNGKKVGVIKGAFPNEPFDKLLDQRGIHCQKVEFSLAEERSAAISSGAVDYVVEVSTAYQNIDLHAVYEFGERYSFYLAVTPARKDLLTELNRIQEDLDNENPGFLYGLKMKYFKGIPLFKVLPSDGVAWLDAHKSLRIGAYDKDAPYVIANADGTVSGIAPEYVAFMLKSLNINIPVEWKIYNGREAALEALRAKEIDLINPYYCNYGDAERDGVVISESVFNSNFSVLYQGAYSSDTMSVIATPSTRLGKMYVRDNYPHAKIVSCQNGYDCVDKLLAGEANYVVMHADALSIIASKYNRDFHMKPLNTPCPVSFAALPENVALLLTLDKAIPFLTDVEMNAILDKYNNDTIETISPEQFFKRHPEYIIAGLTALLVVALLMLAQQNKANKKQIELARAKEEQRRIDMLHEIIHSGKWSFFLNAKDEIVDAKYSDDVKRVIGNDLSDGQAYAWAEILHPDDKDAALAAFKATIADHSGNTPYDVTYRMKDRNGEYHWFHSAGKIIRDAKGNGEFFGVHTDITSKIEEQMKQKAKIAETSKLIESIAATYNIAYAVNLTDDSFRLIRMDDNIIGKGVKFNTFTEAKNFFIALLPECDQDWMSQELDYDTIRKKLAETKTYSVEYRVPINGAIIWHEMNVTQIDDEHITLGFAIKDLEITKNHLEDKRFGEYFALYEVDIDSGMGKIVKESPWYGNKKVGTALPYTQEFLKFAATLDDEPRKFFERFADLSYVKTLFASEDKHTYAYRSNNIGDKKWVECTGIVTMRHRDGTPAMFSLGFCLLDSLGIKQQELQQQLKESHDAAEAANKSKTNFLFSMSHDIRTPMNAITGFTHMAIKHIDEKDKVLDCLDKIQKSGSMLLSLINSVLEVSRIESGHAVLEKQHGDVFYSFSNIEQTLQELAKTKDIELTFEFGEIRDRYVYADFNRCMRIFVNVISNAIKYTQEGGFVKVHCEQIGEAKNGYASYLYTVTDNGIGMSEEFQKHIFEQFARENTATVSGIQGTGLGMPVVKSFVELMGGTVSVKSKQGDGTTITIILPFKLQKGEKYTDPVSGEVISGEVVKKDVSRPFDLIGKKILLVEDNELNREIAIELLQEEGLFVEEAEDGSIAVDMLKKKGNDYYDFILMDVQMPIMDGYEATRQIRAGGFTKPIIALSANAFAEDKAASLASGMNAHVAKPINMKILMETLRSGKVKTKSC